MKPTRRTQPLRATRKRRTSTTLRSAQKGAPKYLTTTHMTRRAALRKRKGKAKTKRQTPLQRILAVRKRM